MKAELKPLQGKYYGSQITIIQEDGSKNEINVWIHDKRLIPSQRELERGGYKNNKEACEDDHLIDTHFESDIGHKIYLKIIDTLNSL
jgi:hypothetical protein